jgi:outer membrane protein OmpA-like peptidoglycan-associated protein
MGKNIDRKSLVYLAEGLVINEDNGQAIADVNILVSNEVDKETFKVKTNAEGKFELLLQANRIYQIRASHSRFLTARNYRIETVEYVKLYPITIPLKEIFLGKAVLVEKINFEVNDTTFTKKTYPALVIFYEILSNNPQIVVEIAVHTDSRGNDDYNLQLSQQRAAYIVQYLIKKGIATERLQSKGYGETHLVNHCANGVKCGGADHEANRRVEFVVVNFVE